MLYADGGMHAVFLSLYSSMLYRKFLFLPFSLPHRVNMLTHQLLCRRCRLNVSCAIQIMQGMEIY